MFKIIVFALIFLYTVPASAADSCASSYIKNARIVGQGQMKVAFWHIYDAALYAPAGAYSPEKPYALKLVYRQNIKAKDIVKTSVREMKKNGLKDDKKSKKWEKMMSDLFPDIKKGDNLTGVNIGEKTVFCQDSRKIGVIEDREFARYFFGIWLSPQTSAPELRSSLLGNS